MISSRVMPGSKPASGETARSARTAGDWANGGTALRDRWLRRQRTIPGDIMNRRFLASAGVAAAAVGAVAAAGYLRLRRPPVGNPSVPQPAKPVELERYLGLWYELARYENWFERDAEAVTAQYSLHPDGKIRVLNRCNLGAVDGPRKEAEGRAFAVPGSGNTKLKVSFFGPLYVGDYWVLDHAEDYAWSIVGSPSGRYLWLLCRTAHPADAMRAEIEQRTRELGYDWSRVRHTQHPRARAADREVEVADIADSRLT
jgi:apolipoprotein D and lipocalin family protein